MFNKMCCKERQIESGVDEQQESGTSRCELSALAGAAVVVSVLGAELGASVGEAARPSSCATEALDVKAGFLGEQSKSKDLQ